MSTLIEHAVTVRRPSRAATSPAVASHCPVCDVQSLFELSFPGVLHSAQTEFVRTISAARITMRTARVRPSARRQQRGDALQALCFLAGANSIFYGEKLLTTGDPDTQADLDLLTRLNLQPRQPQSAPREE
jgi:hypothetical protein